MLVTNLNTEFWSTSMWQPQSAISNSMFSPLFCKIWPYYFTNFACCTHMQHSQKFIKNTDTNIYTPILWHFGFPHQKPYHKHMNILIIPCNRDLIASVTAFSLLEWKFQLQLHFFKMFSSCSQRFVFRLIVYCYPLNAVADIGGSDQRWILNELQWEKFVLCLHW